MDCVFNGCFVSYINLNELKLLVHHRVQPLNSRTPFLILPLHYQVQYGKMDLDANHFTSYVATSYVGTIQCSIAGWVAARC